MRPGWADDREGVAKRGGEERPVVRLPRPLPQMNADTLDLLTLQAVMQHCSIETTKLYVNMAGKLKNAAPAIYVPDVLRAAQ